MSHDKMRTGRLLGAALLGVSLASCDFVSPTETNPNSVPSATLEQLFTGIQVNTFLFAENQANRIAAMWINQLAGTDRQFAALDTYVFTEGDLSGEFSSVYVGGGLVDLRRAIPLAEDAGFSVTAGILKIHQAYLFGMAASLWGDIPYSQAGQPNEFPEPALDEQADVYASVQSLLDEAIADLATGTGGPGATDMVFGGDPEPWTAVAHSLKARFHLHWAEVDPGRYAQALSEAQLGIDDPAHNWTTVHTTASTEANLWFQFFRDRDSYARAGSFLVDLMNANNDPRVPIYFLPASGDFAGQFVGAEDGGGGASTSASQLNVPATATYGQPIITCAETQFIAAEAALQTSGAGAAQPHLQAGIACQEAYWASLGHSIDIPDPGAATLETIIEQKYIANFLNMEVWNDYKRTCLPAITPLAGGVPGRPFYGQSERETNPNLPPPDQQPARNDNDPNPCP